MAYNPVPFHHYFLTIAYAKHPRIAKFLEEDPAPLSFIIGAIDNKVPMIIPDSGTIHCPVCDYHFDHDGLIKMLYRRKCIFCPECGHLLQLESKEEQA